MSSQKTIGAKIELDGGREYTEQIKSINSSMNTLTSESKLLSNQFKDSANTTEALTSKHKNLTESLELQKSKLEIYSKALSNSKNNLESCSANVDKWKSKVTEAEEKLSKLKSSTSSSSEEIKKQEEAVEKAKHGLSTAEKQYSQCSNSVNKWKTEINNAESKVYDLNSDLKKNDRCLDESKKSTDGCAKSIDNFGKETKETEKKTSTFGSVLKANLTAQAIISGIRTLGNAIKDVGTKMYDCARNSAKYGDEILTMSTNTHISTDELQEYKYAAELMDVSIEDITKSLTKNTKTMSSARNGSKEAQEAYKSLNVTWEDGNGNLRKSEDVFWDVIDALGKMTNDTERDALSMQIFGKSAQDLNSLIEIGSQGFKKYADEAKSMGAVMDKDTLISLHNTDDAMQRLDQSTQILQRKIGASLAPALTMAATKITAAMSNMGDKAAEIVKGGVDLLINAFMWIVSHGHEVISVLSGIGSAFVFHSAVSTIGKIITGFQDMRKAIQTAKSAQDLLSLSFTSSPIMMAASVLAGITAAVITYKATASSANEENTKFNNSLKELSDRNQALTDGIKRNNEERNNSVASIKGNYTEAKKLVEELYSLNDKTNKNTTETTRMKNIVEQLNALYPTLGLQLDVTTGKLNKNKNEVKSLVDQLKEEAIISAFRDSYKKAVESMATATQEVKDAKEKEKEATDLLKSSEEAEKKIKEESLQKMNNGTMSYAEYTAAVVKQKTKTDDARKSLSAANDQEKKSNNTLEESKKSLNNVSNSMNDMEKTINGTTNSAVKNNDKLSSSMQKTKQNNKEAIDAINEKYKAMQTEAEKSIKSQLSLFDEFNSKSDLTKAQLKKNLQSQIDGMNNWNKNMGRISRVCSSDFVAELKSMGISSAGQIKVLASMSDKELKQYEAKWRERGSTIKSTAVTQVGSAKNELNKIQSGMVSDINNKQSEFAQAGRHAMEGLEIGINSKARELYRQVSAISDNMLTSIRMSMQIGSPSKITTKYGEWLGEGLNVGLRKISNKSKMAANTFARDQVDSIRVGINQRQIKVDNNVSANVDSMSMSTCFREAMKNLTLAINEDGTAKFVENVVRRVAY